MGLRPFVGRSAGAGTPPDLDLMRAVQRAGRAASPLSGYWHPGEIVWWYGVYGGFDEKVTVWTDGDVPIGWCYVDPAARAADMGVRPAGRGGAEEDELVAVVERALRPGPVTVFAWAGDEPRQDLLERRGYRHVAPVYQTFARPLAEPVVVPGPPAGFRLLPALTEEWATERSECHHRAFDPSAMTPERYAAFRSLDGYDAELDVALVADDGRLVSYAMVWADDVSGTGQFEPVGTRPHFWRRGLGRVVMLEGLRRLRTRGTVTAGVNTYAGHAANIAFYESCGFEPVTTIDRWVRP